MLSRKRPMASVELQVARMVCVGFDGLTITDALRELIARGVRSVILFSRNYQDRKQVTELCREIKSLSPAGESILICVDHEGGRVQRFLKDFTPIPSMRDVGQRNDEQFAQELGRTMARELRACNIDL